MRLFKRAKKEMRPAVKADDAARKKRARELGGTGTAARNAPYEKRGGVA